MGESGSGKTTLGRLLLRLIQPDAGRLEFEGQRFDNVSGPKLRAMRPQLQMVFQSPYGSLNPRLNVLQIVEFNLRPLGLASSERRDRAAAGLLQVGLTPAMLTRFPHELSGGQAQRVGIARAIVSGPKSSSPTRWFRRLTLRCKPRSSPSCCTSATSSSWRRYSSPTILTSCGG